MEDSLRLDCATLDGVDIDLAPPEARRRKVTPEGRIMGGQVVCAATAVL